MQVWLKEKLFLKSELKNKLLDLQKNIVLNENPVIPNYYFQNIICLMLAAAFYPSPFQEAIIFVWMVLGNGQLLSLDWKRIIYKTTWEISFPHSMDYFIRHLLIIVDLKLIQENIN